MHDAYVAIFQIDTDGIARLVFPRSPSEDHYARGGRDYRLLFPGSPYWYVQEDPGVGYFFLVASPEPFDFSAFRFSPYARGWDLSLVGRRVYRDPYVATDDYVAALISDWERAPYALDFATYNVGERYEYPRFLCYDCHGFRNYATWNPYYAACVSFRVVIFDDPYFYPARRYRSDRVVWTQPVARDRPRFAFREREGGEPAGPLIQARTTPPPAAVRGPAPRRDPSGGAGGVVPSAGPTDLGVIRGRPSRPAAEPAYGGGIRGNATAPSQPSGVAAPAPRRGSEGERQEPGRETADPSRVAPEEPRERVRPVLRRWPSEGAGRARPANPPASPEEDRRAPEASPSDRGKGRHHEPRVPSARGRSSGTATAARRLGERRPAAAPPRDSERAPAGLGGHGCPQRWERDADRAQDAGRAAGGEAVEASAARSSCPHAVPRRPPSLPRSASASWMPPTGRCWPAPWSDFRALPLRAHRHRRRLRSGSAADPHLNPIAARPEIVL